MGSGALTEGIDQKVCSKCKLVHNINKFYSKGAGRFDSRCKRCVSEAKTLLYRRRKSGKARSKRLIRSRRHTTELTHLQIDRLYYGFDETDAIAGVIELLLNGGQA